MKYFLQDQDDPTLNIFPNAMIYTNNKTLVFFQNNNYHNYSVL